jgi:uncharacterized protein (DUF58 family)
MDDGYEKSLRLTAKKHDLIVIRVSDPAEEALPHVGLVTIRDPETGQVALINTNSKGLRQGWRRYQQERVTCLADLLKKAGVDLVELSTNGPVVEPLTRLFETRRKRL